MDWTQKYSLFLFDFDGLLVNTEYLHYQAYQKLVASYGFDLGWSFEKYCSIAHASAEGLRIEILKQFPSLQSKGSWDTLYQQKKDFYLDLLHNSKVPLMPGAEDFLNRLFNSGKRCVVVTHSSLDLIESIRSQHPVLQKMHAWITREDYEQPKPSPQCYQLAIEKYAVDDRVIGFEDSPRGMRALMGSGATALMVCDPNVIPPTWSIQNRSQLGTSINSSSEIFHASTLEEI